MRVTDGAKVESSLITDTWMRADGNSAAVWAINADNTLFQFNEVRRTRLRPEIEPGDGMAFDADMGTLNTVFRANYSVSNEGGLVLFCGCNKNENGQWAAATGTIVENNFSINDGRRAITAAGSRGSIVRGNIIASTSGGAPVLENPANFDANEVTLIDNVFITGNAPQPIVRRKNLEASYKNIRWLNNQFIGNWTGGPEPTRDQAKRVVAGSLSTLFRKWSKQSGFAKHRFDGARLKSQR